LGQKVNQPEGLFLKEGKKEVAAGKRQESENRGRREREAGKAIGKKGGK